MATAIFVLLGMIVACGGPDSGTRTEKDALASLVARKARWDESKQTLMITGAGDFKGQDLLRLQSMPGVKRLHIAYTLADEDLAFLKTAPSVEQLSLTGAQFSDGAVFHVAAMPWLTSIELENCGLTARGIAALGRMRNLQHVSLREVWLSEHAMTELKSVPGLHTLTTRKTTAVKGLADCQHLRRLELKGIDRTRLSDDALVAELGQLKQVESLLLSITERPVLPAAAANWLDIDFERRSLVASRHYPVMVQLRAALPVTEVVTVFTNPSISFRGPGVLRTISVR